MLPKKSSSFSASKTAASNLWRNGGEVSNSSTASRIQFGEVSIVVWPYLLISNYFGFIAEHLMVYLPKSRQHSFDSISYRLLGMANLFREVLCHLEWTLRVLMFPGVLEDLQVFFHCEKFSIWQLHRPCNRSGWSGWWFLLCLGYLRCRGLFTSSTFGCRSRGNFSRSI